VEEGGKKKRKRNEGAEERPVVAAKSVDEAEGEREEKEDWGVSSPIGFSPLGITIASVWRKEEGGGGEREKKKRFLSLIHFLKEAYSREKGLEGKGRERGGEKLAPSASS